MYDGSQVGIADGVNVGVADGTPKGLVVGVAVKKQLLCLSVIQLRIQ